MPKYRFVIDRDQVKAGSLLWGLEVLRIYKEVNKKGITKEYAECRCKCGDEFITLVDNIRNGSTKTCGCYLNIRGRGIINIDGTIDTSDGVYKIKSNTGEKCITVNSDGLYRVSIQYKKRAVSIARTFHNIEAAKEFRDYATKLVRDYDTPINEIYRSIRDYTKELRIKYDDKNYICNQVRPGVKMWALEILRYADNYSEESHSKSDVVCRCKCGKVFTTSVLRVANGNTRTCGCYLGLKGKAIIYKDGSIDHRVNSKSKRKTGERNIKLTCNGYYTAHIRHKDSGVDVQRSFRTLEHAVLFRNLANDLIATMALDKWTIEDICVKFAKDLRDMYDKECKQNIKLEIGNLEERND